MLSVFKCQPKCTDNDKTALEVNALFMTRSTWHAKYTRMHFCKLSGIAQTKASGWHFAENETKPRRPKDCLWLNFQVNSRKLHFWSWQLWSHSDPVPLHHVFCLLWDCVAELDGIWSAAHFNRAAFMWSLSLWFESITTTAVGPRGSVWVWGTFAGISDLSASSKCSLFRLYTSSISWDLLFFRNTNPNRCMCEECDILMI